MARHPAEIIQKKRDGRALDPDEIREFVAGVVDGTFGDAQLGAFLMAVCCRGMTTDEIAELTLAMRDSGTVLDLSSIGGPKVDKHSTGGVGDKVSLVLAPLMAAAGVPVPMISGRGLGHTGGTLDKLAAIPGLSSDLSTDEFVAVLAECGFVMSGPSADLAPADKRMYAVRDVSGTVESIPLITSSILSKKLASGLDGLVMDVKVGRAAFMKSLDDARALADSLVRVGTAAGKQVRALLTDMDVPLGRTIGNALEVQESIDCLRGGGPADLREIVLAIGDEMLGLAGRETDLAALLDDGSACAAFERNVARQGGSLEQLPTAPVVATLTVPGAGFVTDLDPLALGRATVELGGGRRQPTDTIDPRVGLRLLVARGDAVASGDAWIEVHAAQEQDVADVRARLETAIVIGAAAPAPRQLILDRL